MENLYHFLPHDDLPPSLETLTLGSILGEGVLAFGNDGDGEGERSLFHDDSERRERIQFGDSHLPGRSTRPRYTGVLVSDSNVPGRQGCETPCRQVDGIGGIAKGQERRM